MKTPIIALGAVLALSACTAALQEAAPGSDPTVERTGTVATRNLIVAPDEAAPRTGIFGGLFARNPSDAAGVEAAPVMAEAADTDTDTALAADRPRRSGFLGGLFASAADPSGASVQTAALTEPQGDNAASTSPLLGLFGPRTDGPRNGPDARDVTLGTVLPFGEIARVCEAGRSDLGKRIEQAGQGGARFTLHDSNPASTAPRTFYVTGFSDGCPRQFTAALAMFGDPAMHEKLRYGRPSDQYPYSTTDKAYEKVKSAICGVARRKPCGGQIATLSRNTVFVSTYERFTDNGRWADILLHDGTVLAAALKEL